jgi:hypothetical protein
MSCLKSKDHNCCKKIFENHNLLKFIIILKTKFEILIKPKIYLGSV